METKQWYVVCYDITEPKRWRRVYKLLHGYGRRLQYSIFRCWLSSREMERLRWELTELLTAEDDVLFIPLCMRCQEGIRTTHAATKRPDWPEAPGRFEIV